MRQEEREERKDKMAKEFRFYGKTLEELKQMNLKELSLILKARARRKIKKGFTEEEKKLLKSIAKKNVVKTHCREMIILPSFVDKTLCVYNGKEFTPVRILPEMIGHRLGEFALTRRTVKHGTAGVGATRSSKAISAK